MALFNFKKKNEETKKSCCCGGQQGAPKVDESVLKNFGEIKSIKILGSGCKSCHALYEAASEAAKNMNLQAEVLYVTDMEQIASYGAMKMPSLVVNEKVITQGKVLNTEEIEKLLHKLSNK